MELAINHRYLYITLRFVASKQHYARQAHIVRNPGNDFVVLRIFRFRYLYRNYKCLSPMDIAGSRGSVANKIVYYSSHVVEFIAVRLSTVVG